MVEGFEITEEPKALTMPGQQSVGFEDEKEVVPVVDATGEEDQPEAIRLSEMGILNLAVEEDG